MADAKFIQVLLPLKLDWEPYYALPQGVEVQVGDTVQVPLAGHTYTGIVTAVDVTPEQGLDVKQIRRSEPANDEKPEPANDEKPKPANDEKPKPANDEVPIAFWRQLADYYLCTPGEVYKASQIKDKIKVQEQSSFDGLTGESIKAIKDAFARKKTVLLVGSNRDEIYRTLAAETLAKNKSVLHLVPTHKKSKITEVARSGEARYIVGTRSALFLPWKDLGLVIVEEEQDTSYKQDSPAPRFNAREAAIMLANLHGANVILGSETPSLESLYNAETGLFTKVQLKQSSHKEITLINTAAETRKNGMSGAFSIKLLEAMKSTLEAGKKVLLLCRSKQALPECEEELKKNFPEAPEKAIVTACPLTLKTQDPSAFGMVAILQADSLLGKEDFRSDERALQTLHHLASKAPLVIQTREPGHPVFNALQEGGNGLVFLEERRLCNLPPFTRLVNLVIRDHSQKRIEYLSKLLEDQIRRSSRRMTEVGPANDGIIGPYTPSYEQEGEYIRIIRVTLARDKSLKSRKAAIYQTVKDFEKQYKYTGHIVIDVDPV